MQFHFLLNFSLQKLFLILKKKKKKTYPNDK